MLRCFLTLGITTLQGDISTYNFNDPAFQAALTVSEDTDQQDGCSGLGFKPQHNTLID